MYRNLIKFVIFNGLQSHILIYLLKEHGDRKKSTYLLNVDSYLVVVLFGTATLNWQKYPLTLGFVLYHNRFMLNMERQPLRNFLLLWINQIILNRFDLDTLYLYLFILFFSLQSKCFILIVCFLYIFCKQIKTNLLIFYDVV